MMKYIFNIFSNQRDETVKDRKTRYCVKRVEVLYKNYVKKIRNPLDERLRIRTKNIFSFSG